MMKSKLKPAAISLLASSVTIFGCSSSDNAVPTASVPTGAVTITDANAVQVVTDAIATGNQLLDVVDAATAIDINVALTPGNILGLVFNKLDNASGTSVVAVPAGVIIEDTCSGGGDVIIDITETTTTASGSVTLIECSELGITLNGTVSFNSTFDTPNTGDFSDTITGNLTGTDGVDTATLSGLSFSETGNEISGAYTISTYTYAVDFGGSDGFLTELEAPIVGNNGNACPDSGAILVSGSDDTQGKGTIVPGISVDNDIRVEFKDSTGTFVEATGSPVSCTTVF